MRLRSITLILRQKRRACEDSTLTPLLRIKRVSLAGKVRISILCDGQGVIMVDYLQKGRTIYGAYYAEELELTVSKSEN